ncbi:outer membrane protein assembly factor BamB family protein [Pantoea sp. SGAir0184]
MNQRSKLKSQPGWAGRLLAAILLLLGLYLLAGGIWLISLGGNWYYGIAGILSILSGYTLWRGKASAVLWFSLLFFGTLFWTIAESGTDFWRWVPRFALILALAIAFSFHLSTLLPRMKRKHSGAITGALALTFIGAGGLAFLPSHTTEANGFPQPDGKNFTADTGTGMTSQEVKNDWPAYGGNLSAARYSSAAQITPANVSKLKVAWQSHAGDLPPGARWGTENTPLKVGDFLYVCTAANNIVAFDPATGKQKWRFDAQINRDALPYTPACRSLAYFDATQYPSQPVPVQAENQPGQHCDRRIILGTLDDRVIEVDAQDGKRCTDFGNNGEVSILEDMGETYTGYVSITSGPVVVRDTIVVGHQVIDGQRVFGPPGVIKAFDVRTGKLKWAWDAANPDDATPKHGPDAYKRGSPNVWTTFTGDEKLGLVYLPVANPSGDYWSAPRTAAELKYGDSLVALDINTGLPRWNFQTTHHDIWDYDLGSPPTLVDYPQPDGSKVPAIILPTKNAELYVLNRETGKPLFDVIEKPAPQGEPIPQCAPLRSRIRPSTVCVSLI